MKSELKYFVIGIVATVALWVILFSKGCFEQEYQLVVKTDTIYVKKPYKEIVIKEVEVEKPVKVYVYKTDTVYRERIERDTLITSIEITPKVAKIHTITPAGLPMISEYPLPEFKEIKIDHKGNMKVKRKKRRRKFWRTMERVGLFVGGMIIGRNLSK